MLRSYLILNSKSQILENYLDYLDSSSSIRKNNLRDLKYSIDKEGNIKYKFSLARTSLPIIYAHYEGFLKDCFNELMRILSDCGENNNINFLIFNIVTKLDENVKAQHKRANKLLNIFNELTEKNNYLYDFKASEYSLGFDSIDYTFDLLKLDNPFKDYTNYNELKEICTRSRIDPLTQIKSLYDKRCAIAHGNLETKCNQLYSVIPNKDLTENQVSHVIVDWDINYNFILVSIDAYKNSFYSYLEQFIN